MVELIFVFIVFFYFDLFVFDFFVIFVVGVIMVLFISKEIKNLCLFVMFFVEWGVNILYVMLSLL